MDISKIKEKLKSSPKLITYMLIAVVCTALLLVMNTSESKSTSKNDNLLTIGDTEFKSHLEKELENIISKIDGVGKVTVMLTVESTYSYEYVKDYSNDEIETVIIGNKEALISKISNPRVSGVLVVCSGGDNVIVKEKIMNAVATVLDIPLSRVYVAKYNN